MRLDSCPKFPWQMTLGAIQNDSIIYEVGSEMARQFKRIGVNVSFSPVLDVNNNPGNPIINARSFGEDRVNVMRKGIALIAGLQKNGVMACGKHFPGHGDTDKDSHKELPAILHPMERLDSVELFPFRGTFSRGLQSVMVAHLYVPVLDSTKHLATSLSHQTVTGLLRRSLGFDGLVFTDALNMKGVSKYFAPGQVEVLALKAGVDILLMPENPSLALSKIREAINNRSLSQDDLDKRCRRILKYKYMLGLNKWKPIDVKNIQKDLYAPNFDIINRKAVSASLTLLLNKNNVIPLCGYDTLNPFVIQFGAEKGDVFVDYLQHYINPRNTYLPDSPDSETLRKTFEEAMIHNLIIISIHKSNVNPWKPYKISDQVIDFLQKVAAKKTTLAIVFANPYSLAVLKKTIQQLKWPLLRLYLEQFHFMEISL